MIQFECIQPTEKNAQQILEWRNDPTTRAMSFHTEARSWDSYYRFFMQRVEMFPDLPLLFALKEGTRIAYIQLDPCPHPTAPHQRCCNISINVAPEWRGAGIGTEILQVLNGWVKRQGYHAIYAEVKPDNIASQHVFEAAGYAPLGEGEKVMLDSGERIKTLRYLSTLSSAVQKPVWIIAEAGSNWRAGTPEKDLAQAKQLIEVAANAGANAVKFQVYRPETIYVENAGKSDYLAEAGIEQEIRAIFADLSMPYEMVPVLAEHCKKCGIAFMATPFSVADFEEVDPYVSVHKIASYELSHLRLLECAAHSGKPLILSTGAATTDEIAWAVDTFRSCGGKELTLMQCTAAYPAPPESLNLAALPWLAHRFGAHVGLSDHSSDPVCAPVAAVALGATAIEKHFTLSRDLPGPDHAFAIEPNELKRMVEAIRTTEQMRGCEVKVVAPAEEELRSFARRGVQALCEIQSGEQFLEGENIAILRPGKQRLGIHPLFLTEMEGKAATRSIPIGDGIQIGDWK